MRPAQPVEDTVGMAYYVSDLDGVGGRLREDPADFRVREIEQFDAEPLDASPDVYPHLLVRCTLWNWETNDFVGALTNRIGISRERVSWAGTKDKRAVSTQLFSIKGIDAGELPTLDGVEYEVVGRTGRPILFGDLAGNEFEITVRETTRVDNVTGITEQLAAFAGSESGGETGSENGGETGSENGGETGSENGGESGRMNEGEKSNTFGGKDANHSRVDSFRVGVPNYFGQQRFGSRRPVTHDVGLAIVRGDWEKAVLTYVGNPSEREPTETREARRFVEETRDWKAALDRFPRHLGFERAMLHRLAEGDDGAEDFREALETTPTNLQQLFVNAAQSYLFNRMLSKRLERRLPFEKPVEGDVVCFTDRSAPDGYSIPDTDRLQPVTASRLETVTRHCNRGRAFVTAPLVGYESDFSDGEPGEIERTVVEDVGVKPQDFDLPGEFRSEGTRRAILVRTDLSLDFDPLRFSFWLPSGSYATVFLREYLKSDPDFL